jgi:hypothetical protein
MGLSSWLEERRSRAEQRHREAKDRAAEAAMAKRVADAKPRPLPTKTLWLSAAGRMAVVGESHYQPALHLAADGRAVKNFDDGVRVTCALIPEPSNPYDKNAVRVDCLTKHGAVTVGYIDRGNAPAYQQPLLQNIPREAVAVCHGMIMGGGPKLYGIWLSLAPAETMLMASQPPDGHTVMTPETIVTVTGEQNYASALDALLGTDSLTVRHYATLRPTEITKGTHQGKTTLEVLIGDEAVGQLTALMGSRYLPLLHPEIQMCCEATVARGEKRHEVTLHLPRIPAR